MGSSGYSQGVIQKPLEKTFSRGLKGLTRAYHKQQVQRKGWCVGHLYKQSLTVLNSHGIPRANGGFSMNRSASCSPLGLGCSVCHEILSSQVRSATHSIPPGIELLDCSRLR